MTSLKIGLLLGAASTFLIAPQAFAQSATDAADGESPRDNEIVVTAQKREQALIDVPLSITAIGGEELARRSASTINDIQYSVPGLSITEFSPGQQRVQLRGVSVFSGLPTVGVYLDEVPLNLEQNQSGQDVRLLDIKRVEVLRGPQGTLYGQGAVGGTLRYITNDVDLSRFGGTASGDVGLVSGGGTDWKVESAVNTPVVTDKVGIRLAGSYQNFGGWIDNPVLGDRNVNGGDAFAVRGKLNAELGAMKITLMAQHQQLDIGAQNLSDANQQIFDSSRVPLTSKATILNATVAYDLGGVELLSSTSYLRRRDTLFQDITSVLRPFLPFLGVTAPVNSITTKGSTRANIFAQEVRLSSSGSGPFGWTVGGFYRNAKTGNTANTVVVPDVLPPGVILFASEGTLPSDSRSWAVFGEASYQLSPTLTALAGLRYFEDRRVQDSRSTVFNASAVDRGTGTFEALSPRFNLSWQPTEEVNLYANVAKGFRSGGFNLTSTGAGLGTVPPTYDPDTIWTYEVGAKFRTADRRISGELAVYRNEWTDVQTTTNIPGLPTSFTTNGGNISGWGVDAIVTFEPVRALSFTLTGGWNNMEYRTNTVEHFAGDRVDYVPRFTGSASAEYRFELGKMPSYVRVDFQHADRFQVYIRNFQAIPAFSDEQNILNARIGVEGSNWGASLFARNLLNRDSVVYPAFAALVYPSRLQPRVIGASLNFRY